MKTLEGAWDWYKSVRTSLRLIERLGRRHWSELDWGGRLGRDDRLGALEGPDLVEIAGRGLGPLEDLAVLVLFSVFEAEVRERVGAEVEAERAGLRHVAIRSAVEDALDRIRDGSFFRVLDLFRDVDRDLVEQVNQVWRYRNWVAHGRKGDPPARVDPRMAFVRLSQYLDQLRDRPPPSRPPAGPRPAPPVPGAEVTDGDDPAPQQKADEPP